MEKTPGYSKTLPPMRDGLGDSILPPPGLPRHIVKGAIPILDRPNSDARAAAEYFKMGRLCAAAAGARAGYEEQFQGDGSGPVSFATE